MRARRDPFARETLRPVLNPHATSCTWCGTTPAPRRPLFDVIIERDRLYHRTNPLAGNPFCSWACAESYHNQRLAR